MEMNLNDRESHQPPKLKKLPLRWPWKRRTFPDESESQGNRAFT